MGMMVNEMKTAWILIGAQIAVVLMMIVLSVSAKSFLGIMIMLCIMILLILILAKELKRQQDIQNYLLAKQCGKNTRRIKWDAEENEKLKMIRKRMEYTTLQSQIDPHFLYNTLESIRSRALLDGNKEIASMTEILSKFFRYCISNGEKLIKIREEIDHIQDYYYIQKYRFEDKIDMEIKVEKEELLDGYIPKMTLQPLVENAMVHGLEQITGNGKITMILQQMGKKIVIYVEDNGAGMSVEQLNKLNDRMRQPLIDASLQKGGHSGIALTNVNARIRIVCGEEYGIHYRSAEGRGTQAVLMFPYVDEFERVKYKDFFEVEE